MVNLLFPSNGLLRSKKHHQRPTTSAESSSTEPEPEPEPAPGEINMLNVEILNSCSNSSYFSLTGCASRSPCWLQSGQRRPLRTSYSPPAQAFVVHVLPQSRASVRGATVVISIVQLELYLGRLLSGFEKLLFMQTPLSPVHHVRSHWPSSVHP